MPTKSVLLLIADDWYPAAHCYGVPRIQTPHIDSLALRGTVFTQAFCTTPSCSASRATILTGLYSHANGQYGHSHDPHGFRTHEHVQSLPAVLRSAGFTSALIGKAHIAPRSVYPFDHWFENDGTPYPSFSADWLVAKMETFLASVGDRPFYAHVASGHPHRVYRDRADGGFDLTIHAGEYATSDVRYSLDEVEVPAFLPDTSDVRRDIADYWTSVSRFDLLVGKMIACLERSGKANETMVILLSDHGLPFPGAKASPFEAGHHCPLIIADPEKKAGQRCPALVNWCDIMPTILQRMEVAESHWPATLTGLSLLPLLDDPACSFREVTFYSHCFHEVTNYFPYRVARNARYKYVRSYAPILPMPTDLFDSASFRAVRSTGGHANRPHSRLFNHDATALFDLQTDPFERENLIGRPEFAPIAETLRSHLLDLQQRTADPWLEIDYQLAQRDLKTRNV